VTSSGRLVDQQKISTTSGWLVEMELASDCKSMVLPVARRGDNQAALALAHRRQQVHHPPLDGLPHRLQLDPFLGIEWGQVVEENLVACLLGRLEV